MCSSVLSPFPPSFVPAFLPSFLPCVERKEGQRSKNYSNREGTCLTGSWLGYGPHQNPLDNSQENVLWWLSSLPVPHVWSRIRSSPHPRGHPVFPECLMPDPWPVEWVCTCHPLLTLTCASHKAEGQERTFDPQLLGETSGVFISLKSVNISHGHFSLLQWSGTWPPPRRFLSGSWWWLSLHQKVIQNFIWLYLISFRSQTPDLCI